MLVKRQFNVINRKLVIGFKYIRFKYSIKVSPEKVSVDESFKKRSIKLAEIFDCNYLTAREIISRNRSILTIDSENFIRNATFCSKYLKFSDIIEFPWLISLNSSLLQHRYFSLLELGCSKVTGSSILKFPQIIKDTPKILAKQGMHFCYDPNSEYCISFLPNSTSDTTDDFHKRLQKMYEDGNTLWKIKEAMNAEFLSLKLDCSLFRAHQLMHRYPPLRVQSISNTSQLLDLLFEKLGFSTLKVSYVPNLLSLHHEIAEDFLNRTPYFLGIKTVQLVHKLPLLLKRPVDDLHKTEKILKDFDISDRQLMCCPKVMSFTTTTLQQRLEYLCQSEDFAVLKSYTKFLWLVYHYGNLNPRLEALKKLDIPCSISMFMVSNSNFEKYLCFSQCRTHIKDTCHYLAGVFNTSEKEIDLKLREFPTLHNSSLLNCRQVVEFLLGSGVTKNQLSNGLGVIFYDIDVVTSYFKDLEFHPECQPFSEWIPHYNLIQLLIYTIEVDTGFRGSCLYKAKSKTEDPDEIAVSGFAS